MKATLLVGDYLFVSKYSYGYSHYSLPFSPPLFSGRILGGAARARRRRRVPAAEGRSTDYIKRVIGLPGDRIQMIDGVLHINGEPVKRERIEDFIETEEGDARDAGQALARDAAQRRELHHARSRRQRLLRQHAGLSGAGRPLFHDGRQPRQLDRQPVLSQVGYVPFENIIGRAQIIFFSIAEGERAWQFLALAVVRCAGAGCSRSCDEPRAKADWLP